MGIIDNLFGKKEKERFEVLNEKIDRVIELLERKVVEGPPELHGLTIHDKEMLDFMAGGKKISADEIAKQMKLSRGTASLRLNKLYSLGYLLKKSRGKIVEFKIK